MRNSMDITFLPDSFVLLYLKQRLLRERRAKELHTTPAYTKKELSEMDSSFGVCLVLVKLEVAKRVAKGETGTFILEAGVE